MTFALQNALLFPDRMEGVEQGLDFSQSLELSFSPLHRINTPASSLHRIAWLREGRPLLFLMLRMKWQWLHF